MKSFYMYGKLLEFEQVKEKWKNGIRQIGNILYVLYIFAKNTYAPFMSLIKVEGYIYALKQ